MRWDRLFADLDARFDELQDAQAAAESADRERVAMGAVTMTQRLAGSLGQSIRVRLGAGPAVAGELATVGPDWLLIAQGQGREVIVALDAVTSIAGLRSTTGPEVDGLAARFDLRRAVRAVARDRSPVAITLRGGAGLPVADVSGALGASGSGDITGTIDRVGADFVELAVHAAWEPRRASAVRSVVLVPLAAVLMVTSMPWA